MIRHQYVKFIIVVWIEHTTTTTNNCPSEGVFDTSSSVALVVVRGEAIRPFLHAGAVLLFRI